MTILTEFSSQCVRGNLTPFALLFLLLLLSGCEDSDVLDDTGTITGTITFDQASSVDGDVNDRFTSITTNNTAETAQTIPNPVTLGGYLNNPRNGPNNDGNLYFSGDTDDYYAIDLAAGQLITLYTGETNNGAFIEMSLIDDKGVEDVAAESGLKSIKTLTVPQDKRYQIIHLHLGDGATNYVLSVGLPTESAAQLDDLSINNDFVPGEVIVDFKQQPGLSKSASLTLEQRAKTIGLMARKGLPGQSMLFSLGDDANRAKLRASYGLRAKQAQGDTRAQLKQETLDVIRALRKRDDIQQARPNYIRRATAIPDDPDYNRQWHYPAINMPTAWQILQQESASVVERNVIVAVIDTGVLLGHPDLQGRLVAGYDFIDTISNANDGDGRDNNPDDPGDGNAFIPSSFHGTHVAGVIAAQTNNGQGVAGIGWGANIKIMPLRVLGKENGTDFDIEQAVLYAAGLTNVSNQLPEQKADVINLSLGGPTNSTTPPKAFVDARKAGVIIVAAAGNENTSQLFYPASLDGVVSVSAVGIDKTRAKYSNFGSTIDITAPGGGNLDSGVFSTMGDEVRNNQGELTDIVFTYESSKGTSMAAPHVAGVVALMQAFRGTKPSLTPAEFDVLLADGRITGDIGASGRDDFYGHGLIDAVKALQTAFGEDLNIPPIGVATPNSLNFSYVRETLDVEISNGGNGLLEVVSIENSSNDNGGWLSIAPKDEQSVDANGLGVYTFSVDRNAVPPNSGNVFVATASFNLQDVNNQLDSTLQIPVIMNLTDEGFEGDAGTHYVIAYNDDTPQPYTVKARLEGGVYKYAFTDLEFGEYFIVAGSDMDNDDILCDAAEACGTYPVSNRQSVVVIDKNNDHAQNIDFESGFSQSLTVQKQLHKAISSKPYLPEVGDALPLQKYLSRPFR